VAEDFDPADAERFAAAIRQFDEENARDPNTVQESGEAQPRELLYAQWLTDWLLRLCPQASEALRLAARSQHLCRWMIPRNSYPMTRPGYLQWREALKKFHSQKAGDILRRVGYPGEVINRVQQLNLKKGFPQDPETQVLEDGLCLVFLERQLAELARKTPEDKVINALQKAWQKMSPAARALAKQIPYGEHEKELLNKALEPHLGP
jgi:hypothetical protein